MVVSAVTKILVVGRNLTASINKTLFLSCLSKARCGRRTRCGKGVHGAKKAYTVWKRRTRCGRREWHEIFIHIVQDVDNVFISIGVSDQR